MNNNKKENKRKCAQKKKKKKLLKQKNVVSEIAVEKVPDNVGDYIFEDLPNDLIKNILSKVSADSIGSQALPVLSKKLLVLLKDANLYSRRALHVLSAKDANVKILYSDNSVWRVQTLNIGNMADIDENRGYGDLPYMLTGCEMLHTLNIDNCCIRSLTILKDCKIVHTVTFNHCRLTWCPAELAACKTLHTMTFTDCQMYTQLAVCETLQTLTMNNTIIKWEELAECKTLHTLNIHNCDVNNLNLLKLLAKCKTLHTLNIRGCSYFERGNLNLEQLDDSNMLDTLHTLDIRSNVSNLKMLAKCKMLKRLTLDASAKFNELADCETLQSLTISDWFWSLEGLNELTNCKMLKTLTISNSKDYKLTKRQLEYLQNLKVRLGLEDVYIANRSHYKRYKCDINGNNRSNYNWTDELQNADIEPLSHVINTYIPFSWETENSPE